MDDGFASGYTSGALHQLLAGLVHPATPVFWVRRSRLPGVEFSSNLALVLAASGTVADIRQAVSAALPTAFKMEETNGFLNFTMDDQTLQDEIARALREGERYGGGKTMAGRRVLVEFVSADPTGPLPFTLGRIAVAGEVLCRLFVLQGADVTREFFLNDVETSPKMRLLGESVAACYARHFGHEIEGPEGALTDQFVQRIAAEIAAGHGTDFLLAPAADRNATFAHIALGSAVESQRQTLAKLGVRFDVWSSEKALRDQGRVAAALRKLEEQGQSYLHDGAVWLRNSGPDGDYVLVRPGGEPTYLAVDIAYHLFKFERGFDIVFNIWTAEHRQYIERTRLALAAAGCDVAKLEVAACGPARWVVDDRPATHGKGGGAFSLDEALDVVEPDALKILLLSGDWDAVSTIDAELALRADESNPAYAARQLPARLTTMINEAETHPSGTGEAFNEHERAVARLVALWPETAESAALARAPYKVAAYITELAGAVRSELMQARPGSGSVNRIDVLRAAKVVAGNALRVVGIAPTDRF